MLRTIVILMEFAAGVRPGMEAQVERELNLIFAQTQVQYSVMRQQREVYIGLADDVIHVKVTGTCAATPGTGRGGVLARTVKMANELQGFMIVDCDTLSSYINYPHGLGKAMARVLAHELLHYLLQEPHHANDGLFRPKLTRKDLVERAPKLSPAEVDRVNRLVWPLS